MKGPSERLKYDMRRVWECPVCKHTLSTSGSTTSLLCDCQQQAPPGSRQFMRMIKDGTRRIIPNRAAPQSPIVETAGVHAEVAPAVVEAVTTVVTDAAVPTAAVDEKAATQSSVSDIGAGADSEGGSRGSGN